MRTVKSSLGRSNSSRTLLGTVFTGMASGGLYFLLFLFSAELPELAEETRQGNKLCAFVPLVIALIFSFVHGAFTGRFWDLFGLRAKK